MGLGFYGINLMGEERDREAKLISEREWYDTVLGLWMIESCSCRHVMSGGKLGSIGGNIRAHKALTQVTDSVKETKVIKESPLRSKVIHLIISPISHAPSSPLNPQRSPSRATP